MAFTSLVKDENELNFKVFIKFLNYLYRYKIRYIEFISDICIKIDDNNDKVVVRMSLFSK